MPSNAHTFYTESLAQSLLERSFDHDGQLFEIEEEYTVTLRFSLPSLEQHDPDARAVIHGIISGYKGWGLVKPCASINYQPYHGKITVSFPVPTASEQYFPESARKCFLHDYAIYLVAEAVRFGLAGRSDTDYKNMLSADFDDPRHPRDIARLEAKAKWASRLSRVANAMKVKKVDRFQAYR